MPQVQQRNQQSRLVRQEQSLSREAASLLEELKVATNQEAIEGAWEEISDISDVDEEHIGDIMQAALSGVVL